MYITGLGVLIGLFILLLVGAIMIFLVGLMILFLPAALIALLIFLATGRMLLAGLAFFVFGLLFLMRKLF